MLRNGNNYLTWIRRQLTCQAQKAAVSVFTQNLRRILLTPAITGKVILGIDPGYKNGCKLAIINKLGILCTIRSLFIENINDCHN